MSLIIRSSSFVSSQFWQFQEFLQSISVLIVVFVEICAMLLHIWFLNEFIAWWWIFCVWEKFYAFDLEKIYALWLQKCPQRFGTRHGSQNQVCIHHQNCHQHFFASERVQIHSKHSHFHAFSFCYHIPQVCGVCLPGNPMPLYMPTKSNHDLFYNEIQPWSNLQPWFCNQFKTSDQLFIVQQPNLNSEIDFTVEVNVEHKPNLARRIHRGSCLLFW